MSAVATLTISFIEDANGNLSENWRMAENVTKGQFLAVLSFFSDLADEGDRCACPACSARRNYARQQAAALKRLPEAVGGRPH